MSTPEDIPPLRPLENPVVWFLLQVAGYAVATLVFRRVLPDEFPFWVGFALWILLIIGLTLVNYALRRRFIPR
jgi:hypothetical protein